MSDHQALVQWQGGMTFTTTSDGKTNLQIPLSSGFLDADEGERGLSPMGLVLVGLAGCTAMDVISILTKKRQPVTFFEVAVEGDQVDEHPRIYHDIAIVYRLGGKELDENAVKRAIELSMTKYCPVNGMLKDIVNIVHRYEIIDPDAQ